MIKNWEMFNESDTYFDNSPEFEKLVQKYALKKEDIKQFLDELEDECDFEIKRFSNGLVLNIDKDGFDVNISIKVSKTYKTEKGFNGYLNFLKEHTKDLEYYLKVMELIQETENLKDLKIKSNETQSNIDNNTYNKMIELLATFTQEIKTNEMQMALDEFTKTESIAGVILKKVIDELVKRGFDRSELIQKIDIDPDWEEQNSISYGFMTDDDMYIVAEYDKKTKILGFDDELIDDLKEYLDEL